MEASGLSEAQTGGLSAEKAVGTTNQGTGSHAIGAAGLAVVRGAHTIAVERRRQPETALATNGNGGGVAAAVAVPASDNKPERRRARATLPPVRRYSVFRRTLAVADLAAAAGGLGVLAVVLGDSIGLASLLSLPLIVLIAKVTGRYDRDATVIRHSTLEEAPALMTLAGAYTLAWSLVAIATGLHSGRASVIVLWASTAALLITARATAREFARLTAPAERALIVGSAIGRARLAQALASDPGANIKIVGFLPLEDERLATSEWGPRCRRQRSLGFDDLGELITELDVNRVFLISASADSEMMLDAVSRTTALGVQVSIVPRLLEVVGSAVDFDVVGGVTVLGVRNPGMSLSSRAVKRVMDLFGAGLGVIVLLPFAAVVALAIKLDSRGPVFFGQLRVGRDGRTFRMFKFRSMVNGAEAQRAALASMNETEGVFKLTRDPRVTRVGRLLRKTSIDELPQLLNVLRGDMSLVGPRPLVVDEDRLVEGRHRERLQIPPGMTGPWQVLGPNRPPLAEMVKADYLYAANWSLWADIKILLRTFGHVARQRGL
jgi:exopolysaccharide biosynthesis polyprenyl glycosylphosphotransferase